MSLTKQDIDALVDGMPNRNLNDVFFGDPDHTGVWFTRTEVCRALYLAAGLTAEGERKPERVRAQLFREYSRCALARGTWDGTTFVPDGAE